jgi:hypothetical protein
LKSGLSATVKVRVKNPWCQPMKDN